MLKPGIARSGLLLLALSFLFVSQIGFSQAPAQSWERELTVPVGESCARGIEAQSLQETEPGHDVIKGNLVEGTGYVYVVASCRDASDLWPRFFLWKLRSADGTVHSITEYGCVAPTARCDNPSVALLPGIQPSRAESATEAEDARLMLVTWIDAGGIGNDFRYDPDGSACSTDTTVALIATRNNDGLNWVEKFECSHLLTADAGGNGDGTGYNAAWTVFNSTHVQLVFGHSGARQSIRCPVSFNGLGGAFLGGLLPGHAPTECTLMWQVVGSPGSGYLQNALPANNTLLSFTTTNGGSRVGGRFDLTTGGYAAQSGVTDVYQSLMRYATNNTWIGFNDQLLREFDGHTLTVNRTINPNFANMVQSRRGFVDGNNDFYGCGRQSLNNTESVVWKHDIDAASNNTLWSIVKDFTTAVGTSEDCIDVNIGPTGAMSTLRQARTSTLSRTWVNYYVGAGIARPEIVPEDFFTPEALNPGVDDIPGGDFGTADENFVALVVNNFSAAWGFDASWLFGIAIVAICVGGSFKWSNGDKLISAVFIMLGIGLAVVLGLFEIWVLLLGVFIIIAIAGKTLFGDEAED